MSPGSLRAITSMRWPRGSRGTQLPVYVRPAATQSGSKRQRPRPSSSPGGEALADQGREKHPGGQPEVRFARGATRWLGVWLDPERNQRRCVNRARQAEAGIRRLTPRCRVPPASARTLQMAIIQGTMCAAELIWRGQRGMLGGDKLYGTGDPRRCQASRRDSASISEK